MTRLYLACAAAAAFLALPARADVPRLLVAGDDPRLEALVEALQVQLAGSWTVERTTAPAGDTTLSRAAEAQRVARETGARATVWIEVGEQGGALVRVVDADTDAPRFAPLPSTLDAVEPRTFALVTGSLLDELATPPQPIRVRVQVTVETEGAELVVDEATASVQAGGVQASASAPEPPEPERPAPIVDQPEAALEPLPPALVVAPPPSAPTVTGPAIDGTPHHFFGADLAPFVGSSTWGRGQETRNISLALGASLMGGLQGVALSAGADIILGDARGVVASGAISYAGGSVIGYQGSGGLAWIGGSLHGMQTAAGVGLVRGEVHGLQFNGGVAWAGDTVTGAQLAGGASLARGEVHGVQAAGGVTFARGGSGLQLGTVNIQAAPFDGVQLGVVNVSRDARFAFGLVNIVTGGRTHLELTGTSDGMGLMTLKHGAEHWHYNYSVGTQPFGETTYALGFGGGGRATPTERIFLDLDAMLYYVGGQSLDERLDGERRGADPFEILAQLRLVAGVRLGRWVSLIGGVALNGQGSYAAERSSPRWAVALYDDTESAGARNWRAYMWPSLTVGIQVL